KSLSLDLKKPGAVEVARRLAKDCDVLLEGFRPGVMDRLGLGYEELKKENPGLIYCAITGYGQDGPYAQKAGHDINYVGYAGLVDMNGDPGARPVLPGTQVADLGGGALYASVGILAALQARARTGEGQFVDVSMMDGAFSLGLLNFAEQLGRPEREITRGDTQLSGAFPCYGVYECADGKCLTVGPLEEKFWEVFCTKLGRPEWIAKRAPRDKAEAQAMRAEVAALFATKPRAHWIALLENEDACVGPVNSAAEALADPHVKARGLTYESEHPDGGPITQVAFPVKLSQTPAAYRAHAPQLGENTDEVLKAAGYSEAEIAELRESGAV
ncbi:MAG: CoA transferase, partial [Chrysiogenetes bacterium]|nr:CoA transferase [Chrysiogenetes bacterium]